MTDCVCKDASVGGGGGGGGGVCGGGYVGVRQNATPMPREFATRSRIG